MSTWTSSERFWMDVMNVCVALPVLAVAAAVGWSLFKTMIRRGGSGPSSAWPPEGWPPSAQPAQRLPLRKSHP